MPDVPRTLFPTTSRSEEELVWLARKASKPTLPPPVPVPGGERHVADAGPEGGGDGGANAPPRSETPLIMLRKPPVAPIELLKSFVPKNRPRPSTWMRPELLTTVVAATLEEDGDASRARDRSARDDRPLVVEHVVRAQAEDVEPGGDPQAVVVDDRIDVAEQQHAADHRAVVGDGHLRVGDEADVVAVDPDDDVVRKGYARAACHRCRGSSRRPGCGRKMSPPSTRIRMVGSANVPAPMERAGVADGDIAVFAVRTRGYRSGSPQRRPHGGRRPRH